MAERTPVDLSGVPETLLWTLYHRAVEARRADAVLDGPDGGRARRAARLPVRGAVRRRGRLIGAIAERFPGCALLFDALPAWLSKASRRGRVQRGGYQPPPWLWGVDAEVERRLATADPAIAELRALLLPRGRGLLHGVVLPPLSRAPAVRRLLLTVYGMRLR